MQNPDIARLFDEVADLLEIQDANPFRVRAYRNAARTIRYFPEPIADLVQAGAKDLTDIPGIGEDLAEKITDIVTTGELPLRKELASKLPAGLLDLLRIPGLGPKRVKLLYKKLKVKSAADLAKALDAGKVRKLKGFGPKMEEKMRAGLGQAQATERRMLLNEAETQARAVEPAAYGAALQYFTGSKAHNVELRKIAQEQGYKLNEYGLFKGTRRVAGQTEEEIYRTLGLDWIPPELREARGEIALAREHR